MYLPVKKKYTWVIDLVKQFGIGCLNDSIKTPRLLHVLYSEQSTIQAIEELRFRQFNSPINENHLRNLIYSATGDMDQADKAAAYFILNDTRKQNAEH